MYIHCYHGSTSVFNYREIDIDDDTKGPVWLNDIVCPSDTLQYCLGACQTCPVGELVTCYSYDDDIAVQCSELQPPFIPQLVGKARQLGCSKIVLYHVHGYYIKHVHHNTYNV